MIYEITGDILLSKAQVIAHGISPNEHFDSGLALALRDRWPSMAKDYRHYAHQTHPKAGELWTWASAGVQIVNLLTQDGEFTHGAKPGRASVGNVSHSLRRLRHLIEQEKFTSIALPALATGAGGLAWADVRPLIQQYLGDLTIPVYVYTVYHKDQAANEAV